MNVDHRSPVHDNFCRCRGCKPSPVGARSDALLRIRIGALGLVAIGVLAAFAVRVSGPA